LAKLDFKGILPETFQHFRVNLEDSGATFPTFRTARLGAIAAAGEWQDVLFQNLHSLGQSPLDLQKPQQACLSDHAHHLIPTHDQKPSDVLL